MCSTNTIFPSHSGGRVSMGTWMKLVNRGEVEQDRIAQHREESVCRVPAVSMCLLATAVCKTIVFLEAVGFRTTDGIGANI